MQSHQHTNGRYIYTGLETGATIIQAVLWLYFGTGDTTKNSRPIFWYAKIVLYGIKDTDFPNFVSSSSSTGTVVNCINTTTQTVVHYQVVI